MSDQNMRRAPRRLRSDRYAFLLARILSELTPQFPPPKGCPAIWLDGGPTLDSARLCPCCANLNSGSGGASVRSPGGNGSAGPHALLSCDAAASVGTWRRKPPAAHIALGDLTNSPALAIAMPNAFMRCRL